MSPLKPPPTVSWPALGAGTMFGISAGALVMGEHFDPGASAIGVVVGLMGVAATHTLLWLVRR